jgi:molybdenum cofactor cytidylyltransferase
MTCVAAVVLAAGRSTRMGENKMLADIGGEPLIRRTVRTVLRSQARPVIVVAGHQREALAAALAGLDISLIDNPRYGEGLSTSLIAGIGAVPPEASGALVALGDMPLVDAGIVDALISRFAEMPMAGAVVPVHAGEWGNPVLIARKLFAGIAALEGDAGARKLLKGREDVLELETQDPSILIDADTPDALAELRERLANKRA